MQQYYYLIHIQYLGFRFHGWAKQPNVKTVHQFIDKTLPYVLGHNDFKTLGSSRTDAMVSANHFVLELFLKEALDLDSFFS
jgi:tRNA pseudouridine38-40 synthase